jgi:DUF438 domain-containing protein
MKSLNKLLSWLKFLKIAGNKCFETYVNIEKIQTKFFYICLKKNTILIIIIKSSIKQKSWKLFSITKESKSFEKKKLQLFWKQSLSFEN